MHNCRGGERAARGEARAVIRKRRLWSGWIVERRFSSFGAGSADGPQRSVLLRLFGPRGGAGGRVQVWLSVSGTVEPMAREASGHAGERLTAVGVRHVFGKPRSGFEFTSGPANSSTDASRALSGDDGAAVAR